jgi:hypothetical protein
MQQPLTRQYQVAEEAARAARRGMWALGDRYESPRASRHRVGISPYVRSTGHTAATGRGPRPALR